MIVRTFSTKFSGFYLLFETAIPQSRNAGSHSIHREMYKHLEFKIASKEVKHGELTLSRMS